MNIYTTIEPTPSRVLGLFRLLLVHGGEIPQDGLSDLFHPAPLRNAKVSTFPVEVLAAAIDLGLIERVPGSDPPAVRVAGGIAADDRDP